MKEEYIRYKKEEMLLLNSIFNFPKMATIIHSKIYTCSNDCLQSGCPTHEAKLTYQSTSDAYEFENGKGEIKYFERGELEAFISLLKGINRFDCIQI